MYHSCSFWKLGSCVSPMMSRGALLCSTSLAEWDRAGQRESLLKGRPVQIHTCPSYKRHTIFRACARHTSTLCCRVAGLQCVLVGERHQCSNTVACSSVCCSNIRQHRQYRSSFYCRTQCKSF